MKDYEVITFENEAEIQDYIKHRTNTDIWLFDLLSFLEVVPAPECIFFEDADGAEVLDQTLLQEFIQNYNVAGSLDSIVECMKDTKLFLMTKNKTYPIRRVALRSLLNRAKISGTSIQAEEDSPKARCLPTRRRARILTQMLQLYDQNCQILYRDEKVSAILSDQYAVLAEADLYAALQVVLHEKYHDNYTFVNGSVSHEHFSLCYSLQDEDMEEDLEIRLNEAGFRFEEVHFAVKFLTSDIGEANASVYPYLILDRSWIPLGSPIHIKHFGKNTVKDFEAAIKEINSLFERSMFDFKKLSEQHIEYPSGCFRFLGYEKKLPKKLVMSIAAELDLMYPGGCCGFDILMNLTRILEAYDLADTEAEFSKSLTVSENVARAMRCDFSRFDRMFEWKRGENE